MEGVMATIMMFAGNFAPKNWAYCQGQIIPISTNSALFALLGTTFGGDGRTNFKLPDLQGRVPVGTGNGPGLPSVILGQVGGSPNVTLLQSNMPPHTHTVNVPTTDGQATIDDPNNNILAFGSSNIYTSPSAASGSYGGVIASVTGGGQPIGIMPPYLGMNYVICLYGIFPSRN
jgi:microcystin-dependent protein